MKISLYFILTFFSCITYGQATIPFVTTWETTTPNESIFIPTTGGGYNYTVDWGDNTTPTVETGDAIHTYVTPGIHTVNITGNFPRIYFNAVSNNTATTPEQIENAAKLLTIEQWGDNPWSSMQAAFEGCVNLNITNTAVGIPDLSNVTDISNMFQEARSFNFDISNWDVSNVTRMIATFDRAEVFNQDIGGWIVDNVTSMNRMFENAAVFDQDIGGWNVDNVTNISRMFEQADTFNQDIGDWNVSNVTNMRGMFLGADIFNQDIGQWDVSNVTDMGNMFGGALAFNQNIGGWDVSSVTDMFSMFFRATSFNQDLNNWDVSNVTEMFQMFFEASSFNGNISNWNVSNVTRMSNMFREASSFNQDISLKPGLGFPNGDAWNTSSLVEANSMFSEASSFNQDIGNWNTALVTNFTSMFADATSFDQDLSSWNVENVLGAFNMFNNVTLSTPNYDALLIGWNAQNLQPNVNFSGGNSLYCSGEAARTNMATTDGWNIIDGGLDCTAGAFITTWETTTVNESITIPTNGGGYNYTVDWGDGTITTGETGEAIHIYTTPDIYTVIITGDFPRIFFNADLDNSTIAVIENAAKIQTIEQWGDIIWSSMAGAFRGCVNLQGDFNDSPDLSIVTSTLLMFAEASSFDHPIGDWDVSNITQMGGMFLDATMFNQDLSTWDVSNVNSMSTMFFGASNFNGNITNWDVSNVTSMGAMFAVAVAFNQDI